VTDKILLAGPFVGEFGWELFCWQGRIRWLAKHKYKKVYVVCQEGHEVLYEDFAYTNTLDIPYGDRDCNHDRTIDVLPANRGVLSYNWNWSEEDCRKHKFTEQAFVNYGGKIDGVPDIILHARKRSLRPKDNWGRDKYEKLIDSLHKQGLTVGTIGLSTQTEDLEVDKDYRDHDLRYTCDVLASTKCIVGTVSGPMHLAALCKTPQVIFTHLGNIGRCGRHWNPFNAPCIITKEGWHPSVQNVNLTISNFLDHGVFNIGDGTLA
jgi:ADP-heptose:LPS heptosyltransferase